MTKKDYIMLARVIGEAWASPTPRLTLVKELTRELSLDNPRFDCERFAEAVETARLSAPLTEDEAVSIMAAARKRRARVGA
jgi:hypothetical protein